MRLLQEILEPAKGIAPETVQGWLTEIGHLSTIHNQVQQGGLNREGARALLALSSHRTSLSSHSGANWLMALGQVAQATVGRDSSFLSEAMPLLSSVAIRGFIEAADDLPASLVVRLQLLGLKTDCYCALRDFHEALSSVVIQQCATVPLAKQAVLDADRRLASARERGEEVAAAFGDLKDDAEELGEGDADVVWTCLYSRAQLRMALLLLAFRCQLSDSAETIERLNFAEGEMLEAFQFAVERKDHRGAAFAAVEIATKACTLGEGNKESEYCASATQHAEESGDPELVETIQSQLEDRKRCTEPQQRPQWQQIIPEEDIAAHTESLMLAHGWPEDWRRYVEDDMRKNNLAAIANRDFCKHLQPLQNLKHTQSPATIYARPTKYTCSCTLHGHKTRIECDDMEVVINAMRRAYCDECKQREAGGTQGG